MVKQANHPPVSNAQAVSLLEDGSKVITLTASDQEDQNLAFSVPSGQGPSHGSLSPIAAPNCAPVTPELP